MFKTYNNNPRNHPIYVYGEDIGYCILSVNDNYNESLVPADPLVSSFEEIDGIWKIPFYGSYSKKGVGLL